VGVSAIHEEDRRWLQTIADFLDGSVRTPDPHIAGFATVTLVLSEAWTRATADRLRAIADGKSEGRSHDE
jgi:hypothetical protein